jgi:hypothetical protein
MCLQVQQQQQGRLQQMVLVTAAVVPAGARVLPRMR